MRSRSSLLPTSSSGGSGGGSGALFTCSSDRIYLVLALATLVWLGGVVSFIGFGERASNIPHAHAPHRHASSLQPRGHIASASRLSSSSFDGSQSNAAAGEGAGGAEGPSARSSRGFGLAKLAELQADLQHGLHDLLHHGTLHFDAAHEHGSSRYGLQQQLDALQTATIQDPAADQALDVLPAAEEPAPAPATPLVDSFTSPAVVVLTYKRRSYLERVLEALMRTPGVEGFALYVSQDGSMPDLSDLPARWPERKLTLLNHPRVPLLSPSQGATAYLAQHYKWVLDVLFVQRNHSHVILLEDDLIVSPDFLTLMRQSAPLLDSDPSLWCVSSWNDNGMRSLVADPTKLWRTDYFPGLGWMLNRGVWEELSPVFPLDQWDHWMRLDTTHKGRDCLVPEVSRNRNIGEEGTNMGHGFFAKFLAPVAFFDGSAGPAEIRRKDASGRLSLEHMRGENFEAELTRRVAAARHIGRWGTPEAQGEMTALKAQPARLPRAGESSQELLLTYDRMDYRSIASKLGLLPVPRVVHKGLSYVRMGPHIVFLADIKLCPYLPDSLRFPRDPAVQELTSNQGESCAAACARRGLQCDRSHFQFLNECSALRRHFPCPKGCVGGVEGSDIPNFVDNPTKPDFYGFCLTTEATSTCDAAHWSASRLCPCRKAA